MNSSVIAYTKRGAINKANPRTLTQGPGFEKDSQRDHRLAAEFNHPVITDHIRELRTQILAYITRVISFEISETR